MDTEIELKHLRSFIAVAEHLHFGRAAATLHLAQPALSQQIRRLEELVAYPLFLRTSRSVALTPAGEALLPRALRATRALTADLTEIRSIARGEQGSLHVGFIGSGMLAVLPTMLQRYRTLYSGVQLHLHESFTSQVLAGLQDESLDAGLLRDSDATAGIQRETLWTEPYIAALPAAHPLAARKSVRPSMLRDEPFVFYSRSAGTLAYDKPLSLCATDGFRPHVVQEASHWLTILQLISVGFGVSIAPACVRSIAVHGVVCVPLAATRERSVVELALRHGEHRPLVQQFAAVARSTRVRSRASHNR